MLAADGGNSDAQYNLGVIYQSDDWHRKDEQKAAVWMERAANQGNSSIRMTFRRERMPSSSLRRSKKASRQHVGLSVVAASNPDNINES